MADQRQPKQLIGMILMFSAVVLAIVAGLLFTGVLPVDPGVRVIVSAATGVAAAADLGIGVWYFSMGQSS
jgi:hypothetical protein